MCCVSVFERLELCLKHVLAFPKFSSSPLWTRLDIRFNELRKEGEAALSKAIEGRRRVGKIGRRSVRVVRSLHVLPEQRRAWVVVAICGHVVVSRLAVHGPQRQLATVEVLAVGCAVPRRPCGWHAGGGVFEVTITFLTW